MQQLRLAEGTEKLESIKKAYFERSGDISFIKNPPQPRVLEVKVENGVQTVRIVIDP